mmetsp:Transcript_16422/g.22099  ORF Transcript_16422/g.22099 Transcript_16422/m.22099 type:complete len:176 (+) Transcript_16422:1-528(+)
MPKPIKPRKPHKPAIKPFRHSSKWKFRGNATRGNKPHFGKYGLQALEEAWINNRTIEAIRRTLVQTSERKGKVWIKIFPDEAITERTADSRMGAGKGVLEYWVKAVRPGLILFEMDGVEENIARDAFRKAATKLPCKSRFVKKADGPSMFELGLAGLPAEKKRKQAFRHDPRGPR